MIARSMTPRVRTTWPLALLLILALAGCGGSGGDEDRGEKTFEPVFSAIRGLDGEARERKLLELAKKEDGELSLYTSLATKSATSVLNAFEERYDIDVSLYRGTSEVVAQRLSEEAKAGFRGTDVVETGGDEMVALGDAGVFVPYTPAAAPGLIAGSRQDGWTASRFNKFVVSWNTDLVPRGSEPRSWEDLADPRWRGKLAIEGSDADWYKGLREYWTGTEGKSEEEADRLFEGIARNSRVTPSHAVMTELLGAGDSAVAVTGYLHQTRDLIAKGAPVAYEPVVEPVFSRPQGVGLLQSAKHPAAAVLFVEWLLTDGQEVLEDNNVVPARKDLNKVNAREVPIDVEEFVAEQQQWADRFEELVR